MAYRASNCASCGTRDAVRVVFRAVGSENMSAFSVIIYRSTSELSFWMEEEGEVSDILDEIEELKE